MTITCSPAAVKHIRAELAKRGHGLGLRLGIEQRGCSGYAYVVDYADSINEEQDEVFTSQDVKIVMDKRSYVLVKGTHIDYCAKGLNWEYVFHNPNAVAACGCGESFSITEGETGQDDA